MKHVHECPRYTCVRATGLFFTSASQLWLWLIYRIVFRANSDVSSTFIVEWVLISEDIAFTHKSLQSPDSQSKYRPLAYLTIGFFFKLLRLSI